jgi:hypothetical protein
MGNIILSRSNGHVGGGDNKGCPLTVLILLVGFGLGLADLVRTGYQVYSLVG